MSLHLSLFCFSKLSAGHDTERRRELQEYLSSWGTWGPVTHPLCFCCPMKPLQAPTGEGQGTPAGAFPLRLGPEASVSLERRALSARSHLVCMDYSAQPLEMKD